MDLSFAYNQIPKSREHLVFDKISWPHKLYHTYHILRSYGDYDPIEPKTMGKKWRINHETTQW